MNNLNLIKQRMMNNTVKELFDLVQKYINDILAKTSLTLKIKTIILEHKKALLESKKNIIQFLASKD